MHPASNATGSGADRAPKPGTTRLASGLRPRAAVATVAAALVAASLPVFLLSALAPAVQAELGFAEASLGGAVAAFFLAAAVSSVPGGRFADRFGATIALRTGLLIAAVGSASAALLADSAWSLGLGMFLTGTSLGFVDTGGARAIAAAVPSTGQGLAFGSKEASIPTASFLAGASVPVFGAHYGWRATYLVASGLAVVTAAAVSRRLDVTGDGPGVVTGDGPGARADTGAPPHEIGSVGRHDIDATFPPVDATPTRDGAGPPSRPSGPLLLLSLTSALGGAAAAATTAFLVTSSVAGGISPGAAGSLLAGASGVAIVVRLGVGSAVDRRGIAAVPLVAAMLSIGAIGVAVLAVGSAMDLVAAGLATAVLIVGAALAIGAGWGWTGLVFLAAVRLDPARPARAAGIVLAGLGAGGAVGPAAFGAIAGSVGYLGAWSAAFAAMATAGIGAVVAHRLAIAAEG